MANTTTGIKTTTKWSNSTIPLNKQMTAKPNAGQMRNLLKKVS